MVVSNSLVLRCVDGELGRLVVCNKSVTTATHLFTVVNRLVRNLVNNGLTIVLMLLVRTLLSEHSARPIWRLAIWFRVKPQAWTCLE